MDRTSSVADVSPYDFKEVVEKAGLAYITFNHKDLKDIDEQIRLDKYVETAALSFCGTRCLEPGPLLNWVMGPDLNVIKKYDDSLTADYIDDKEYLYKLEQRRKCTDRMLAGSFIENCALPDLGAIITLKAEHDSGFDNIVTVESTNETFPKMRKSATVKHSIPAAHLVVRVYPSGYVETPKFWHDEIKMQITMPPEKLGGSARFPDAWKKKELKKARSDMKARGDMMEELMSLLHMKIMKGVPHIYLNLLSVAPEAQGQGMASRLMRGLNVIADQMGCACYLETGSARLISIYNRYGYETVETTTLRAKCDAGTDWMPADFIIMTRSPTLVPHSRL